ncbi:MAG: hypothetical protein E7608_02760 [Ruminococcaceae bacterium]|nr:hypothetical protein [Oscillospiraceae bacterium]
MNKQTLSSLYAIKVAYKVGFIICTIILILGIFLALFAQIAIIVNNSHTETIKVKEEVLTDTNEEFQNDEAESSLLSICDFYERSLRLIRLCGIAFTITAIISAVLFWLISQKELSKTVDKALSIIDAKASEQKNNPI